MFFNSTVVTLSSAVLRNQVFSTQGFLAHSTAAQSNQINCTVPKEGFVFLSEQWIMSPAAELGVYP